MKYVGVADDIIFASTGEKVAAEHINVPLEFGDLGLIELDLSGETYRKIRDMLKPVFAAAESLREPDQSPLESARKEIETRVTPEMRHTDGVRYKAACRVWAKKVGRMGEIKSYYFPVGLCADFDAYLVRSGNGL